MSWFKPVPRPEKVALDAATVELARARQEGKSALQRLMHVLEVPVDDLKEERTMTDPIETEVPAARLA
jgi:hypothetical protein